MTVSLGLIGAGRVAQVHVAQLQGLAGIEVVAVADPRADAAAHLGEVTGAAVFSDFRQLLNDPRVNAVDIAVPHNRHYEVASAAIAKGLHVFLEKPLAADLTEATALVALADHYQSVFMVCHNLLFHPAVIRAKELLRDKPLGRLTCCRAWSRGWLDLAPGDFRLSREATGGGAWVDTASHLLYVLEDLVGPISDIVALVACGDSRLGEEDNAAGMVRFDGGGTGSLQISYSDWDANSSAGWPAAWHLGYQLSGTQGAMQIDLAPSPVVHLQTSEVDDRTELEANLDESFAGALREFVDAIENGRVPRVSAGDALRTFKQVWNAGLTRSVP